MSMFQPLDLPEARRRLEERSWDAFVCCASFEDRSRQVAGLLNPERVQRVLVGVNGRFAPHVERNRASLVASFGGRTKTLVLRNSDPVASADAMVAATREHLSGRAARILVDVTTFTHEHLLILLKVLAEHVSPTAEVLFAYAGAGDYCPGQGFDEKWLSSGVREVRSVLGFAGEFHRVGRLHFIGLVGFEVARMRHLIDAYEPASISLGYCRPEAGVSAEHQRANAHFHRLVADVYSGVSEFQFSAKDPLDAEAAIATEVRGQGDDAAGRDVVVAPLNTKLSTIGAGLAAAHNPSIRLIYAEADSYNYAAYSEPGDKIYLFSLPTLWTAAAI